MGSDRNLGYISEVELTGLDDGVTVASKKEDSRITPRFLTQTATRIRCHFLRYGGDMIGLVLRENKDMFNSYYV